MNLNTGLLVLTIALLCMILLRPQPGRYIPVSGPQVQTLDTATGHICVMGSCQ